MKSCERLGSVGVPSFSIHPAYLKIALNLLISGTERIRKKFNFMPGDLENCISRKLVAEMHVEQEQSRQYSIRVELFSGTLSDPNSPDKLSEIDISMALYLHSGQIL
jgi:hypothetical protein